MARVEAEEFDIDAHAAAFSFAGEGQCRGPADACDIVPVIKTTVPKASLPISVKVSQIHSARANQTVALVRTALTLPITLDQDADSEALCGAANPGHSRLSAGSLRIDPTSASLPPAAPAAPPS